MLSHLLVGVGTGGVAGGGPLSTVPTGWGGTRVRPLALLWTRMRWGSLDAVRARVSGRLWSVSRPGMDLWVLETGMPRVPRREGVRGRGRPRGHLPGGRDLPRGLSLFRSLVFCTLGRSRALVGPGALVLPRGLLLGRGARHRRGGGRRPRGGDRAPHLSLLRVLLSGQSGQKLLGGGTVAGFLVQGGLHQVQQARVQPVQFGCGRGDVVQHRGYRGRVEGRVTGAGEGHQTAPREDVGGRRGLFPEDQFGRHVRGCPHELAGTGDPAVRVVHGAGDTEVDHLGADGGEQHVRGFEVAVDHPRTVDGGQRRRHAHRQALQCAAVHRPLGPHRLEEVGAGHVFRHDEQRFAVQTGIDDPGGGEAGHSAGRVHLTSETPSEGFVIGQVGVDQLDGDGATVLVLGEVDGAHAAAPESADDAVTVEFTRVPRAQGLAAFMAVGRHSRGSSQIVRYAPISVPMPVSGQASPGDVPGGGGREGGVLRCDGWCHRR